MTLKGRKYVAKIVKFHRIKEAAREQYQVVRHRSCTRVVALAPNPLRSIIISIPGCKLRKNAARWLICSGELDII